MEELSGAQKDFLTGFYTRDHLISSLLKRIIEANLRKEQFSILLIDIDHFKKINDRYGHLWGDEFLKYISSTLRLTLQDKGFIFRYGGDEFVVLFSSPDPKEAFLLAKQFNLVMRSRPFLFKGHLFKITLSCGLATYPDDAKGADDLLKLADKALYFSKRFGRNTTTRVGKIGWRRFKIILVVVLEAFFIMAAVSLLNTYFFKGSPIMAIKRLCFRGILPVGLGADTTIVLKSGEVILGSIISEDQDKLVVEVVLGQGSCTMNIEKSLIQDIIRSENKKKKGEK